MVPHGSTIGQQRRDSNAVGTTAPVHPPTPHRT